MNAPYYLESIQEILLTCLYTSCVKGAVPVSAVLVGESGTAKSKLLQQLTGASIHQTDSFTSIGLFDITQRDKDNKLRWIITPDLNPTLSRKSSTVIATVSNLLTLTMDGTCRVDDGRSDKIAKHEPMGFLSAMTPDIYNKQAKKWLSLGLRRRIIPLFYVYTQSTVDKLLTAIREDKISGAGFPPIKFSPNGMSHKPLIPSDMSFHIQAKGVQFSQNLGLERFKDDYGKVQWFVKTIIPISPVTTLRTLARAHALKDRRAEVGQEDLDFLTTFMDFTNQSFPKQI
jgi:hypothetical protein